GRSRPLRDAGRRSLQLRLVPGHRRFRGLCRAPAQDRRRLPAQRRVGDADRHQYREDGLVQLRPRDPRICRGYLEHRADTDAVPGSRRMTAVLSPTLDAASIAAIVDGRHGDPFAVLGPHEVQGKTVIRAFLPGAASVAVIDPESGAVAGTL